MIDRTAVLWLARASAVCAVLAIVTGALATDHVAGLSPLHKASGVAAIILALPLMAQPMARILILAALLLAVLPVPAVLHALAAPLLIGPAVAFAFPLKPMASQISRGLRNVIVCAPPLILLQMAMGAAYRHKIIGVLWHLAGAMSVAALVVIACVLLLRQIPTERAPRLAAGWLNGILVTQVTLGMSTLLLRMLDMDAAHVAAAHIAGGSLTFAGSLVLLRATQAIPQPRINSA